MSDSSADGQPAADDAGAPASVQDGARETAEGDECEPDQLGVVMATRPRASSSCGGRARATSGAAWMCASCAPWMASSRAGAALLPRCCENRRVTRVFSLVALLALTVGISAPARRCRDSTGLPHAVRRTSCAGTFVLSSGPPRFSAATSSAACVRSLDGPASSTGQASPWCSRRATPTCAGRHRLRSELSRVLPYGRTWSKGASRASPPHRRDVRKPRRVRLLPLSPRRAGPV